MASKAATAAASGASATAANVKDNVFSMFGGGPKKERKEEEEEDVVEKSGSSKAKKDAEAEEDVSSQPTCLPPREMSLQTGPLPYNLSMLTACLGRIITRTSPTSNLSLSFA